MRQAIVAIVTAMFAVAAVGESGTVHFTFPVPGHPNWGQAIQSKTYNLNQTAVKRIAWGISGRFAGIGRSVPLSHHKYGIEIKFIYEDGKFDWFEPSRKFTVQNPGWQHFSGVYLPRRPVKQAMFFYRLATPGEAWYDGVTLFELPDEPARKACRISEADGRLTLENGFLRCTVLPNEGATMTELIDKKTGINYAGAALNRRMLLDKFRQGGDCYTRQWKAEVKKSTPDEVIVDFHLSGAAGQTYLDVTRRMTLTRGSAALDVLYSWFNQPASMAEMVVEPWVVNGLTPYGARNQGLYYPTAKGVVSAGPVGGTITHRDAIGGWYAAHGEKARTMAFQFDWAHYAETWFYFAGDDNLMSDVIYQPVKIPAGKDVSTPLAFFPLAGIERPDWIENGIAADLAVKDGRLEARFDGAKSGVFNVELEARRGEGETAFRRGTIFISPDGTAAFRTDLPGDEVRWVSVKAYSGGDLAFEAERAFADGHTYAPKRAKAKPAEVKPFELTLGRDLVTPHATFAKPYAGGKPKVLFLTSIHQAREIVELMERIDVEPRTVRVAFSENTTSWAMIEQFGTYKYREMNISLKKELETRFDVIVVSGNLLDVVDKDNRAAIDRQVAAGAGFIRVGLKLPPLKGDEAAKRWIAGNVSPELLPFRAGNLRAAQVEGHREVMFDYDGKMGLTPFVPYTGPIPPFRYQDYSLGVVGRAILWAAKMDVAVPPDAQTVDETVPVEPGFAIRHTFRKGPKGVYDWKAEALHERKPAEFKAFEVEQKDHYAIGERVRGKVELTGGTARVELSDGFGRLLAAEDGVVGDFALPIPEARTGMLFVDALLKLGGKTVDVRHAKVVCARPWKRAEYPLCISEGWITYSGEKQYLLKPRMEVYRNLGIDLIRFWDSRRTDSYTHILPYGFDLDFSIYDARIGASFFPKFADPYAKTRDKKYLCRQPCLHDPEYRKALDAQTRENVARIAKFCPVTCDCGDENTLTRWTKAFDFCFSEHTLKAFREWLRTQYADLKALNAAWGTDFAAWDAVVPDTTEEARERAARTGRKSYAAWADHRRFMELTFCETIERVGRILHERLPDVPLDMSGTQAPNGWTGMDMWLISKSVGEPAAYANGYLGDLVRSFGRPFVKPWIGYGIQPKAVALEPWDFAFRFLDAGIYFWTCFNFLLPDYSPTPTAVQYGKTGEELRRGAARLLRSLESRPEVLIHYSYASIHAAQIEERYEAFMDVNEKWLRDLRARSIPYRYVAYAEIEEGELDRTAARTLVLPHSAAISDREAAAIRRFAARGGKVIGDAQTGRLDQHCTARATPVLRDVVKASLDLGPGEDDGISTYPLHPRADAEGRCWGFTRALDAGEGVAERTVRLDAPAYVYDLRAQKPLGKVSSFKVPLRAGEVGFFAALPYEVGAISASADAVRAGGEVKVSVQVEIPRGAKACHPVVVYVYAPDGKRNRLYSGVCDAKGGKGEYRFRTALNDPCGVWRVVATDYITGKTAVASFRVNGPASLPCKGMADVTIGTATSMERIMPRSGYSVKPAAECSVRLARYEKESFQLLVTSDDSDLRDVKVSCSDLSSAGATLKSENVRCDVVGYVWTEFPTNSRYNISTHFCVKAEGEPGYTQKVERCKDAWYPDPILDFLGGIEIRKGDVQSFWIRVSCPESQPVGTYRGTLTVSGAAADGRPFVKALPLFVRVNDFAVPKASPLPLAVTFDPMSYQTNKTEAAKAEAQRKSADPLGPVMLAKGRIPEWGDFLADYYLTMDSLYTHTNLHWEVLAKLRDEGRLGRFNLGYWGYFKDGKDAEAEWRAATLPRLRRNYEKAKELGILDKAYIYGCDEVTTNFFENIRTCVDILKHEFPGVPISTTAYDDEFGVGTRLDVMDWFTPITPKFDREKAVKARAAGHQVWWYICCGPGGTWANAFTQYPPIDLRVLMGPQTVRMRPDGFLYYQISIWNADRPITSGPFTDWAPRSYMTLNGDGCWTAVGPGGKPLSTLRLENFRDGLEDYAYALQLERKLAANPGASWAVEAKALLAVPQSVMRTMNDFNDAPAPLYAWRDAMADLLERQD